MLLQLLFWQFPGPKLKIVYFGIVFLHLLYLFVELITYALFTFNIFSSDSQFLDNRLEASTAPWAQYDSLVGYRGIPGSFRNVKHIDNTLVYDHTTHINKQGWFSTFDFVAPKKPGIKRYAVLGDSFSAGFNVPNAWPKVVDGKMYSTEFYNFSLEGIGIQNWYLIYFNEILRYEFDGLIIAISSEHLGIPDLDRKLMVMHSQPEATYIGQFDSLPSPDEFDSLFDKMIRGYSIVPQNQLNNLICSNTGNCKRQFAIRWPDLYFLRTALTIAQEITTFFEYEKNFKTYKATFAKRFPNNKPIETFSDLSIKYPKAKLLQQIIVHSQGLGKEVILVGIPDLTGSKHPEVAARTIKELRIVAEYFNISYFNGFSCFADAPDREIYYYKNDLHWNQSGVYRFSDRFVAWWAAKNQQP